MHRIKETNTRQVGLEQSLQTSLYGIERKATRDKKHKFQNLYKLLNRWNLGACWRYLNKKATYGVDKKTCMEFKENLGDEIAEIEMQLIRKSYRANLVRRVEIEKDNGKKRALGIPVIRDKLLQALCSKILEAIYEPIFVDSRYGYRRNKGAKEAVEKLKEELNFGKYGHIVEADIKGFFDNIDHNWMIKMLEEKIEDKAFLKLINKWLKAGIMTEKSEIIKPRKGTPQGGVISPILANIYLHYALDIWFDKVVKKHSRGECMIIQYADDYVCAFRYREDAERFIVNLEERMKKFGLELANEKTKLIRFGRFTRGKEEAFDFLGFTYKWSKSRKGKDIVKIQTSLKKLKNARKDIKEYIKKNRSIGLNKMLEGLNQKLRGYYNYYGVVNNWKRLSKIHQTVILSLYKWLNRRSQKKSYTWEEYSKMLKRRRLIKPFIRKRATQVKLSC